MKKWIIYTEDGVKKKKDGMNHEEFTKLKKELNESSTDIFIIEEGFSRG